MSIDRPRPTPEAAERRFRDLLRESGLDQPDCVEHDPLANELIFMWEDRKVAIVLELDDGDSGPPV